MFFLLPVGSGSSHHHSNVTNQKIASLERQEPQPAGTAMLHILDTILVHCILHILGTILVHCLI